MMEAKGSGLLFSKVAVAVMLVLCGVLGTFAAATNLVPNPGFETDVNPADGIPDIWTDQWPSIPPKSLDPCEKISGNYSWKFENDGSKYSGAQSDYIAVDPETTYQITAWVKSQYGTERVIFC